MPLYMDVHSQLYGATADAIAKAHQRDREVQEKHGVRYLRYWLNEEWGRLFCLLEAPSKEAATSVHAEAHGLVANEIWEVTPGGDSER